MRCKVLIGMLSASLLSSGALAAAGDVDCGLLTKAITQGRLVSPYADFVDPRWDMMTASATMTGATKCSTNERYVFNGERRKVPMRHYSCRWDGKSRAEATAATDRLKTSVGQCLKVAGRVAPTEGSKTTTSDDVHFVVGTGAAQTIVTVERYLQLGKDGSYDPLMNDAYAEVSVYPPSYLAAAPWYRDRVLALK